MRTGLSERRSPSYLNGIQFKTSCSNFTTPHTFTNTRGCRVRICICILPQLSHKHSYQTVERLHSNGVKFGAPQSMVMSRLLAAQCTRRRINEYRSSQRSASGSRGGAGAGAVGPTHPRPTAVVPPGATSRFRQKKELVEVWSHRKMIIDPLVLSPSTLVECHVTHVTRPWIRCSDPRVESATSRRRSHTQSQQRNRINSRALIRAGNEPIVDPVRAGSGDTGTRGPRWRHKEEAYPGPVMRTFYLKVFFASDKSKCKRSTQSICAP